MPNKLENIPVVRHLKDVNNLGLYGTDSPLEAGQKQVALEAGKGLYEEAISEGFRGMFFISSPKLRAIETAAIMRKGIAEANPAFRTALTINYNIRELDQGKLKLPADYAPGTHFSPLNDAWAAFWTETFTNKDLTYRFGSTYAQGELRYPEFLDYFEHPGECYRDQAIRLYSAVHEMGKNVGRFQLLKPIVVTHGAPVAIFKDLEAIGTDARTGATQCALGGLAQLTWDYYGRRHGEQHHEYGQTIAISLSSLYSPDIMCRLKIEIDYLNQL